MDKFRWGEPAVVTTDRKLSGTVQIINRESELWIEFVPQSFRGQKGWIDTPYSGGSYRFLFYVQDGPRAARVESFEGANYDWPVLIEEQVQHRFGNLMLGDDDLALDPKPVGNYIDLPSASSLWRGYLPGREDFDSFLEETLIFLKTWLWRLKAREATLVPELYVAGLREHSPQMSEEKIQESLEGVMAEWCRLQERGYRLAPDSIRAYLQGTLYDWPHVVRAAEQAERGDLTAFAALIRRARVDPSIIFRPPIAYSEPLRVQWE